MHCADPDCGVLLKRRFTGLTVVGASDSIYCAEHEPVPEAVTVETLTAARRILKAGRGLQERPPAFASRLKGHWKAP